MFKKATCDKLKIIGTPILFLLGGFLLWEIYILISGIPQYFLPRPVEVIFRLLTDLEFFGKHLSITMLAAISGFLLASVFSFIVASSFIFFRTIERGLYPYVIVLRITPIITIIPFLILWFGIGFTPKIITAALICFFPILVNLLKGLKTVDEEALYLFKSFFATKWQVFLKLRLPSSLPFLFAALKTSTTLAITGAFAAEWLGASKGIGFLVLISAQMLDSTTTFAALAVIILAGLLFFCLISFIERRVVFWQKEN